MAAAPLAEEGRFGLLFATAALIALPLGRFGSFARRRYGAGPSQNEPLI
jgi:hypothetical protein